jgi:hypothetical protein
VGWPVRALAGRAAVFDEATAAAPVGGVTAATVAAYLIVARRFLHFLRDLFEHWYHIRDFQPNVI